MGVAACGLLRRSHLSNRAAWGNIRAPPVGRTWTKNLGQILSPCYQQEGNRLRSPARASLNPSYEIVNIRDGSLVCDGRMNYLWEVPNVDGSANT